MQKSILTLLLLVTVLCSSAQSGTVILNVQNIRAGKGGALAAAIFKKQDFLKIGKELRAATQPVSGVEMQIIFNNIPAGTYAMVAFQDIDNNNKLSTNFIGFPKEPFGFSRDAKLKFGPPDFDDAKIDVPNGKTVTVTITLR